MTLQILFGLLILLVIVKYLQLEYLIHRGSNEYATAKLLQNAARKHQHRQYLAPTLINQLKRSNNGKERNSARIEQCPLYAVPCTNNKTKSRKKKRK